MPERGFINHFLPNNIQHYLYVNISMGLKQLYHTTRFQDAENLIKTLQWVIPIGHAGFAGNHIKKTVWITGFLNPANPEV